MSQYRNYLKERDKYRKKVEDLKDQRDLSENDFGINIEINKNKFKYKFYNYLLKKGNKIENKN